MLHYRIHLLGHFIELFFVFQIVIFLSVSDNCMLSKVNELTGILLQFFLSTLCLELLITLMFSSDIQSRESFIDP